MVAVASISQHHVDHIAHSLRTQGSQVESPSQPPGNTAPGVVWLVRHYGEEHLGQAVGDALQHRIVAAMGEEEVAVWQDQALRDITFDADVGRLGAERRGILIASYSDDEVQVPVPQTRDDGL